MPLLESKDLNRISSLSLASVGDAVFELMVRTRLCIGGEGDSAKKLHQNRVRLVNASAQAGAAAMILPMLTPDERAVYMRGRNQKPTNIPKTASRCEYNAATALEALFGYLYLSGHEERLMELFNIIMDNYTESAALFPP